MQTIIQKAKSDNELMKILRISEIRHKIAYTSKGELTLMLPFEGVATDYWFTLDSVKVDEETNSKLLQAFNGILYTI